MRPPEPAPDIIGGRRVRRVDLEIAPGITIAVLEASDAEAVLDESVRLDSDPYAAILWPSSIATAMRLASLVRPGDIVLDVGAGTGLAALTAARLDARAIALDHDPFARQVVIAAAALQHLAVDVIAFDMRDDQPLPHADIVVMADLLYEPVLAQAAAQRTLEAIAMSALVIVGDPARFGRAEYQRMLHEAGVAVEFDDVVVPVPGEAGAARVGVAVIGARP